MTSSPRHRRTGDAALRLAGFLLLAPSEETASVENTNAGVSVRGLRLHLTPHAHIHTHAPWGGRGRQIRTCENILQICSNTRFGVAEPDIWIRPHFHSGCKMDETVLQRPANVTGPGTYFSPSPNVRFLFCVTHFVHCLDQHATEEKNFCSEATLPHIATGREWDPFPQRHPSSPHRGDVPLSDPPLPRATAGHAPLQGEASPPASLPHPMLRHHCPSHVLCFIDDLDVCRRGDRGVGLAGGVASV